MEKLKDKYVFGVCRVNEKGQIVIPKEVRKVFNIEAGDSLIMLGDRNKGIALVKTEIIKDVANDVFNSHFNF